MVTVLILSLAAMVVIGITWMNTPVHMRPRLPPLLRVYVYSASAMLAMAFLILVVHVVASTVHPSK